MARTEPTGLARPLASVPCTRVGRRELCQGLPPARPPWHPAWKPSSYRPWSVGLAEIGDKTQILALMLAGRFLRPVPIIFGILLAARRAGDERCGGAVGRTRWVKRRRFIGGEQLPPGQSRSITWPALFLNPANIIRDRVIRATGGWIYGLPSGRRTWPALSPYRGA